MYTPDTSTLSPISPDILTGLNPRIVQYARSRSQKKNKLVSALEAGYARSTALKAKRDIESTQDWKALINSGKLADENLAKIHSQFLAEDNQDKDNKLRALQLAYKIKGRLDETIKIGYEKELEGF